MSEVCLPGLQGFPVQVSGWTSLTEKSQIIIPNDIYLQFSPSETPMKYFPEYGGTLNFSGSNSFFVSGNQYNVYSVRLTKPSQEGLQSFSGNAVAEFQIWGRRQSAENEFAVLVVPIFIKPIESYSGAAILRAISGEASRIIDCIPASKEKAEQTEIVRYKTCVETDSKSTPMIFIDVAYWSTGSYVKQSDFIKVIPNLAPAGIPFSNNIKLLTSFTQLNDENLSKSDRKYEVVSNETTTIPYKKSVSLSATSKEFQNAFRIIKDFTKEKEDSEPKYIPINLETDIKDGILLVDLKTGKKLSAEEVEQNLKKTEVEIQAPNINTGLVLFLKIVGVIIGLTILIFLISIFQRFVTSSNTSSSINSFETVVPSST
jgi:hypothetical protein